MGARYLQWVRWCTLWAFSVESPRVLRTREYTEVELSITVFLADDHAVLRDGLRALLESQDDFTVVGHASDGREAVNAVLNLRPDVAILDIAMPELNGIEATSKIIETYPDCAIIILTMYSTSEHIFRALKAGARGYLLKESAGAELVNAVRTVFAGHRYLSDQVSELVIDEYLDRQIPEDDRSPLDRLSQREREVLQLVVEGKPSAQIAKYLCLSPKTVETYRSRVMRKLNVADLPALIRFAIQNGITPLG